MNILTKTIATILVVSTCLIMTLLGSLQLMEGYNFLHPDIDTYYTPGFDQKKFDSIKSGMNSNQVVNLLGQPRSTIQITRDECIWYYSGDGKSDSGDYAWLSKQVHIDSRGRVIKTIEGVYFD